MKHLLTLFFLLSITALPANARVLKLVEGHSYMLRTEADLGIKTTFDSPHLRARLFSRKGEVREILLIPTKKGRETLSVYDSNDQLIEQIDIEIVDQKRGKRLIEEHFQSELSQGIPTKKLKLVPGLSTTLELESEIGQIYHTASQLFDYRRIKELGMIKSLLIIPKAPGSGDFTILKQVGSLEILARYYVEVLPRNEANALQAIKDMDGDITELAVGNSPTFLKFDFPIGPIYLTDPELFDYRRVQNSGASHAEQLRIIAKKSGITDMTIHSPEGRPVKHLFFRVVKPDSIRNIAQHPTK